MNKVVLMGRLTKDVELKFTPNNRAVCKFSIAVKRDFKKQGEDAQTDFFTIVGWQNTAEFCNKYFKKGQRISVIGRLETSSWTDNEGNKRYVTEVIAQNVYFADGNKDNNSLNVAV